MTYKKQSLVKAIYTPLKNDWVTITLALLVGVIFGFSI